MENASSQNSSSTTVQHPQQQQQQQQQPSISGAEMYPAGATGWPVSGRKVLPRDYTVCEFVDLVELIGHMLMQLISINDKIPISADKLTRFHSRATPAITVTEYLTRIVRYSSVEKPCLLSVVFYIDLLSRKYPAFSLSSLTVHRFLITAVTVASKGLCDAFCTNTHYAKVGGLGVAELNMLELEFLKKVDWKIVPEPSVLEAYYTSMVSQDARYIEESLPLELHVLGMSSAQTNQSGSGLHNSHGVPGVKGMQTMQEMHTIQGQTMHGSQDMQGIHNSEDPRNPANRNRTLSHDENFDDRDPIITRTDNEMDTEMDTVEP